jgi:hypothetical protein
MKKQIIWIGSFALTAILVSAVLVDYLSNITTTTISIESPILNEISSDNINFGNSASLNGFGGETKMLYMRMTNRANSSINGNIITTINSANIACNEFSSVIANIITSNLSTNTVNLIPTYCTNNTNYITLSFNGNSWPQLGQDNVTLALMFAPNAIGSYSISTQVKI